MQLHYSEQCMHALAPFAQLWRFQGIARSVGGLACAAEREDQVYFHTSTVSTSRLTGGNDKQK